MTPRSTANTPAPVPLRDAAEVAAIGIMQTLGEHPTHSEINQLAAIIRQACADERERAQAAMVFLEELCQQVDLDTDGPKHLVVSDANRRALLVILSQYRAHAPAA